MEPGEQIGDYIIIRQIGEGGMSVVYLAEHKDHGTQAVVKRLRQQLALNEQLVNYFVQGARLMQQLRHPHLAAVYEYLERDDRYFMVEEYLSGGSLADLLARGEPIPEDQALLWCRDALRAVDYAHQNGIVHRDLKPGNLMLNQDREVKVTDFGIAKVFGGPRLTKTGDEKGTPLYMSPEQIRTPDKVHHSSDVYSMGVVLYELLTRRVPFDGESEFDIKQAVVRDPPPPPRQLDRSISREAERIVVKALQKRPENRFSGCGEFALDIDRYLSSGKAQKASTKKVTPKATSPRVKSPPAWNPLEWIKEHRGIAAGLLLVLLALILVPLFKNLLPSKGGDKVVTMPTVELAANPLRITAGQEATLEWKVQHADTVRIEPGIGEVAASGSQKVLPAASVSYVLTATGPGGTTTKGIDLTVDAAPESIPAIEFAGLPARLKPGESARLEWKVQKADKVRIDPEIGEVAATGTKEVNPAASMSYVLTATGPGGISKKGIEIVVMSASPLTAPTISITAKPPKIRSGETVQIEWQVQNAYRIRIDPDIGEVQTSGSKTLAPAKSVSYTLTATGKGGIVTHNVDIAVEAAPLPTLEFTANPGAVIAGHPIVLTWKAQHATTVRIEPGLGDVGASGSRPVTPAKSVTYVATATGPGGTETKRVDVMVRVSLPVPTISLAAKPSLVKAGEAIRLEWTTQNAQTVNIEGIGAVEPSGSRMVKPGRSGSVALTAKGPGGTETKTITIVVADGNAIKIKNMECKSRDNRPTTCDISRAVSGNDRILGVVFWKQNGRSAPCIEGGTYRIEVERGIIGVNQGCDAEFRVFYRAR